MLTLNRTLLRPLVKFLGCIRSAQSEKLALLVVVHCVFFLKQQMSRRLGPEGGMRKSDVVRRLNVLTIEVLILMTSKLHCEMTPCVF